ncbi:hypothetical protein IRY61_03350 [Candidatus Saccharibacteria bacterium]|nr:hypothetical protein [Candidatus Saccharibacteria bacterium]
MKQDISLNSLAPVAAAVGRIFRTYGGFFLFLLLACIYGFLVLHVNKYSDPVIDDEEVMSRLSGTPRLGIDESAAEKLLLLEDNSVNVQTLFKEGRQNPFQE